MGDCSVDTPVDCGTRTSKYPQSLVQFELLQLEIVSEIMYFYLQQGGLDLHSS